MIADLLNQHGITLDSDRGQHFLDDETVITTMVNEAALQPGETVLEIGAGLGTITQQLAEQAGTVIAYENDDRILPALQQELDGYDNVEIHAEDVMAADIPDFDACVANIPFHLSSEIIEFLGKRGRRAVLIVQQEFADRLVAEPGSHDYSRITIRTQYHFTPVFLQPIPRTRFVPEAEVDAAMVKLFPRNESFDVDEEFFFDVVRALFTHKRKKVRNAFTDSRHFFDLEKEEAKKMRDNLPHSEERVVNLDIYELVTVADWLQKHR